MKIFIPKKQYAALVDLLYLADWMLHAHQVDDPAETAGHRDVMQMLFARAKEMQAEDLVEKFNGRFYPSRVVEDRMQPVIDAYDEASMWEDLTAVLAARDATRALGEEGLRKLSREERLEVLFNHEEIWGKEFEQHGLSRLIVDNAPDS